MTARTRNKLLGTTLLVALVGLVSGYVYHLRPQWELARFKRELLARGEKLDVAEVLPPPPASSVDGTEAFHSVMALFRSYTTLLDTNAPKAMEMVAPGRAFAGWQAAELVDFSGKRPTTNQWDELTAALNVEAPALAGLAALIERPHLDWNLNYAQGFDLLLPHLSPQKRAVQRAQAALLLELHRGHPAAAVQHLRAQLALAKAMRDERLIISQLVRIAIAQIAFANTWAALQAPGLTDAELAAVQADWAELEFALPMENALVMERAMGQMTLARMRESSAEFRKLTSGFGAGRPTGGFTAGGDWAEQFGVMVERSLEAMRHQAQESAWRFSWSLVDELTALGGRQVMIDSSRMARSNGCYLPALLAQRSHLAELGITNRSDADDYSLFSNGPNLRKLFSESLVSVARTLDKVMAAETMRQLALTGIALRRHELRRGNLPAALAQLGPEFLPVSPRDPVDGKPLRYRQAADGFVLYSIGKDGVDDGGDPANPDSKGSLSWLQGRDWVWPQQATAAQVAAALAEEWRKSQR